MPEGGNNSLVILIHSFVAVLIILTSFIVPIMAQPVSERSDAIDASSANATGRITVTVISACNGTGIAGATVTLTQNGLGRATGVTDSSGALSFADLSPGVYAVNTSKTRYWDDATAVTVSAGETAYATVMLWLKGDLNENCLQADAGDLAKMKDGSTSRAVIADWRYDLNDNGLNADAGDLAMMKCASVGIIELL